MGKVVVAIAGVLAGFVLAHIVNQTPEGEAFFARARATLATFSRGISEGFRS